MASIKLVGSLAGCLTGKRADLLRSQCLNGTITVDDLQGQMIRAAEAGNKLAAIRASRPSGPQVVSGATGSGHGKPSDMLQGMILASFGRDDLAAEFFGDEIAQTARDRRRGNGSFLDVIRAAYAMQGREAPSGEMQLIRAAAADMDLTQALGGSIDKVAMDVYRQAPQTWRSFCSLKPATSFREQTGIRVNDMGTLQELGNGGEVKEGYLTEFTGSSSNAWYLFAPPADGAMIAAFLNGVEGPVTEFFGPEADATHLGVSWRTFTDFGAALADPKAAIKSKGEA